MSIVTVEPIKCWAFKAKDETLFTVYEGENVKSVIANLKNDFDMVGPGVWDKVDVHHEAWLYQVSQYGTVRAFVAPAWMTSYFGDGFVATVLVVVDSNDIEDRDILIGNYPTIDDAKREALGAAIAVCNEVRAELTKLEKEWTK